MTLAQKFKFLDRFEEQIKTLKTVLGHLGLYVGLVAFTALGAWIFQVLEFPSERERMTTVQNLTIIQRENLLKMIFNLTYGLDDDEMEALKTYIIHGPDFDSVDYDVRTIMLNTNRLGPPSSDQMTNIPKVDDLINKLDTALLDYEKTVGVAASAGLEIATKEINYQWTYVQSVFFTSTIITTVGYGNMAPVTVAGRAFSILFAMIGIPFTLSVIADVGQIFATLVSLVWGKIKPILMPIMEYAKQLKKNMAKRKRKRSRMRSGGSSNKPPVGIERDSEAQGLDGEAGPGGTGDGKEDDESSEEEEEEEDPMASAGIGANIVMAFLALASLAIFLSVGSYLFTNYEDWTFFEAFYFCFITMTTIGFGDMVPSISADKTSYMFMCMIYILVGLAFTSTIIELVRRQYAESWRKMQEIRAQIQAQLKLADHLRKMAAEGKDMDGMDIDLDELRANLSKYKGLGFDINDLDWINNQRKIKAVTIFFYETSV